MKPELREALDHLHEDFQQWKCGEIDSFDLFDRIHKFHNGPSRDLFGLYSSRLDPRFLVERAVQKGLVPKEFLPTEVRSYIKDISAFGRELPEGVPLTAGDGADNQKWLSARNDFFGQWRVRRFVGKVLTAGEESQKRASLLRHVVANRSSKLRKFILERI